jgi:hypothetical protein
LILRALGFGRGLFFLCARALTLRRFWSTQGAHIRSVHRVNLLLTAQHLPEIDYLVPELGDQRVVYPAVYPSSTPIVQVNIYPAALLFIVL